MVDELTAALRAIIRDEVARQLAELERQRPEPMPAPGPGPDALSGDDILTVQEAAEYTRRHPATAEDAS